MRIKLTAKHPRPASSERAPVRSGSLSARKPTRPAEPKPSTSGPGATRGEDAGATRGGKRAAGAGARGAGGRGEEGGFGREGGAGAGGARRAAVDRPARREGVSGASGAPQRRSEVSSERGPRRDGGERAVRGPAGGERAPRRFEDRAGGGERAPRGTAGERGERAPRRFEDRAGSERAPRRFEDRTGGGERAPRGPAGERGERAPRRFEDRAGSERAPRRFEDRTGGGERTPRGAAGERGERAPRRFEDRERGERSPRRFENRDGGAERAPRRFESNADRGTSRANDDERRPLGAPRTGAGRPAEGGPRGERPARRERDASDRPRFSDDRAASQVRRGGERDSRVDSTPRRLQGERGERSFAKPVKGGYGDRSERPARAPRDERSERAPARREFGDRPAARTERGDRGARSFDKAPAAARRPADDRPTRAGKPRNAAAAEHRPQHADAAPRTPRRDIEDAPGTLRLSKLMSELGLCSRREADEWIEKGWVLVDGERIDTLGTKVRPDQRIEIDPAAEAAQASQVTVLIHKTVGYVSGQAEDGYQPAITLVTPENRWEGDRSEIRFSVAHLRQLAPAGRLDIDSTGLLVLTQDGRIAKQLIGGHSEIDKEYLVRVAYGEHTVDVESHFPPESLALLRHGLSLDDVPLKPAQVSWQNGEQLRFVLREGKKRQIRRMCELVGLEVIGLKRVRMGRVMLGALPPGQWRYLGPDESF
ncbi:pseudouridine synthase [Burkholderia sp. WSM2230]|uniref:pseudouridine synthase n=2 Tax=Pseudomonadota TaxID=1224 RepID=UPI0004711B1B|nr:pseudouridine synthase [Burkholderia sp. WSM2230]